MARSIWAGVRGGSTAMVGTSTGTAPCTRSRSLIAPAWSFVRGTSTRQPYSARDSHQASFSRCRAARPTVTTSVPDMPAAASSMSPTVPATVCWAVVVPAQLTVTGVSGLRPPDTSCSPSICTSTAGTVSTSVPGACDSASKSVAVSTATDVCTDPTGTPAYVAVPVPSARPGTTSRG